MNTENLFTPGTFFTGCNYWAGHAGMMMWRDWRPEAVEREFAAFAANGLRVLRVFPLWSDFQPISRILGGGGSFGGWGGPDGREVRGDGVDAEMLARFRAMCDMAQRHGLRLVVGLVTGWMSGRLFVPPAFEGVNVITDGNAIMWQVRYVRRLVRELRGHPAIEVADGGGTCHLLAKGAEVLADDAETGEPVMTAHAYGKGRVIIVNAPIDVCAVERADDPAGAGSNPAYLIYREAMRIAGVKRLVRKCDAPSVGLTEHAFGDGRTLVMAVNYGPSPIPCPFTTAGRLGAVHRGRVADGVIDLDGNDVAVFEVLD